jgi:hypothetical protein
LALGLSQEQARGSIRLSLGRETVERDIDRVLAVLPGIVNELRTVPASARGTMAEGAAAGTALRDAILKYETEKRTQMMCRFSHLRCLTCPASGIGKGCTLAKWQLAKRRSGAWG